MQRFVIYALARTGSTTLSHALNLHPALRCANEPFNENNFGGEILARVRDERTLAQEMKTLWSMFNGIKHVWHPSGWPFTAAPELNERVATMADAVILLERRNILRRVVSSQMSQQSGHWDTGSDAGRLRHATHDFESLDRDWIERHLTSERDALRRTRRSFAEAGVPTLAITYEELYEQNPADSRGLERVLAFLGVRDDMDRGLVHQMQALFVDPARRLNSAET